MPSRRQATEDSVQRKAQFFLRRCTASVRMLPRFLIIGAQKSGTTTLYEYLNQHPAVARAFTQEVHFFDLNFTRGRSWYRAHFPTVLEREIVRRRSRQNLITGEASAYYLFHPQVCGRVRKTLPEVRLIVVLRDPVERAWAHYLDNRKIAFEDLSFEEAIAQEGKRLAGERLRLQDDERASSFAYREHSYLSRGLYLDQVSQWREVFPPEQIHIVRSEDLLFNDPASAVERVQRFLGLPPQPPARLKNYARAAATGMKEATHKCLREHFRPHNQRLYEYLGMDFDWSS
jgi:sulfotransferase family protein